MPAAAPPLDPSPADDLGPDHADLVVGIITCNHAETVAGVVEASRAALERVAPARRGVVIVADAGSSDGTVERAREIDPDILAVPYQIPPTYPFAVSYDGLPAKGNAVRAILAAAQRLGARAALVVGGNVQSVPPDWMTALWAPLIDDEFDFVTAWHARHKYEGLLTSGLVAPLLRALYGQQLRDPLGGEFAVSARFAEHCLNQPVWDNDLIRVGIDGWLAIEAMCGGFKLAQVATGHRAHALPPGLDTSSVLVQVVAPLFAEMPRRAAVWQRVRRSHPVATFRLPDPGRSEPASFPLEPTLEAWRLGHQSLQPIWAQIVSPATLVELKRLARAPLDEFRWPDDLWARIVYDFALAYRLRVMPRDHLLGALTPLYLGWAAAFVLQARSLEGEQLEARLEEIAQAFERQKPYLIARWRWPDRFAP